MCGSEGRGTGFRLALAALMMAGIVAGLASEARAQGETCGPPPPAKPQRRTAAESFPPLPLPATPLRRTERKRQPSPPALVGKVILGPLKWMERDGKRIAYHDWKTDPADVANLLAWTNRQLGIHYRSIEVDLATFSYDPVELPVLYFTGHGEYALDASVTARLRQYCIDGGAIWGDACCGDERMDASFRAMVNEVFPQRPLEPLAEDHPLYSCFYRITQVRYREGGETYRTGPPVLEGVHVGCRAAIVYCGGYDLSCGWDGHTHSHGRRVTINDARKIGANMVTYVLATYELGRFLSTERVYHQEGDPTRDRLVVAQVIHGGDWETQGSSLASLLKYVAQSTTVEVQFAKADVDLRRVDAFRHPILYMTGHRDFVLADEEVSNLRRYLAAGGVLVANACCGRQGFDTAFRREIARVLPDHPLERIPLDHAIYRTVYPIQQVEYTPLVAQEHPGLDRPTLEGVTLENQLRVVYSPLGFVNGWSGAPNPYARGYRAEDALRLGINILVYAMTH